jgi:hypothetical protein
MVEMVLLIKDLAVAEEVMVEMAVQLVKVLLL